MAGKFLGTLLVERGVLDRTQVQSILDRQMQIGLPFGQIAVMLYNVRMADVWRALAEQQKDSMHEVELAEQPSATDEALAVLPGRLAWVARVLPLRFEGTTLICATTQRNLADAMALMHERLDCPIHFVVANDLELRQHIMDNYPVTDLHPSCLLKYANN